MVHNEVAFEDSSGRSRVTRLGSLRMTVAVAAFAAMPALVMAAPIPGLPDLGSPNPSPQPPPSQPQPQPAPPPSATDDTYSDGPSSPPPPASPTQPHAFSGPVGRTRLGGTWGYKAEPRSGPPRGWAAGKFRGKHVSVPYVPNAWPVTGKRGARNFNGSVGWFVKHFRVPKTGRYAIRFESAHHKASVYINGKREVAHTGAYMPFEARPHLKGGIKHTLVVRTDWRDPIGMKRTGWHRGWFNFGGLNREVTIRPIGQFEVRSPTIQTRLRDDGAAVVSVSANVANHGPSRTVRLYGQLRRSSQTVPFSFRTVRINSRRNVTVRRKFVVQHPALWSPGKPNLYEMKLNAGPSGGWQTIVGLRELQWKSGRLRINGKPIVLYGASIHEDVRGRGDGLMPEDQDAIVARLKRIGANSTRALHPLSPALLERLDWAGILVWQTVGPFDSPGNWIARTPTMRRTATRRVRAALDDGQTHPSVLTWGIANEVADNGHPSGQASWVDAIARELHRRDPSRPTSIDIWGTHIPNRPGRMYRHIDLIGVTSYIGWYEFPHDSRERKANRIRGRVARVRRVFPGKSLFVTEFGAEANALNKRNRHGGFDYQADLIGLHLRTYESLPQVDGMIIWNLSDFALTPSFAGGSIVKRVPGIRVVKGLNQKGLFDYNGRAKPSAREALAASAAVRQANAAAAAGG